MNEWLVWQLADSAFPSGGFAHSGGMEAAWQHGVIRDRDSLLIFIRSAMRGLERGVMGFVGEAWRTPSELNEIDSRCDLFLNNHVANRGSRAQGRAFLSAAAGVFDSETIAVISNAVRAQQSGGHFAPVFGLICREIGIDEPTALRLFTFIFLRSQISVAVRLGIIGPIDGQKIQAELAKDSILPAVPAGGVPEPVQISPVLDLVQGTQDRLYSRLFQS